MHSCTPGLNITDIRLLYHPNIWYEMKQRQVLEKNKLDLEEKFDMNLSEFENLVERNFQTTFKTATLSDSHQPSRRQLLL